MDSKVKLNQLVNKKIVFIHSLIVLLVCVIFGAINCFSGNILVGILIIVAGIGSFVMSLVMKNKTSLVLRGIILSQIQLLIIIVMSVVKHELQAMFPLMLASMNIAAVYYNKKSLIVHWAIMDLASLIGFIFYDFFYGTCDIVTIIKGIAGINIGAALLLYLVKCNLGFFKKAQDANSETEELLTKVKSQVEESDRLVEQQNEVVARIAEISASVNSSSGKMREVSTQITASSANQQTAIEEISQEIKNIILQTKESLNESSEAEKAARSCAKLLEDNHEAMKNMSDAMEEIGRSSEQIKSIVGAIEDIAFQTNILALNASIEAARAGDAGKGFAVVADEVRNLAGKSSASVENTTALINSSIEAVERGTAIAQDVLTQMHSVISTAEGSAQHAGLISDLSRRQAESTAAVERRIEMISDVIAHNVQTSDESLRIAEQVADEATKMDDIVGSFRDKT